MFEGIARAVEDTLVTKASDEARRRELLWRRVRHRTLDPDLTSISSRRRQAPYCRRDSWSGRCSIVALMPFRRDIAITVNPGSMLWPIVPGPLDSCSRLVLHLLNKYRRNQLTERASVTIQVV
jgi:hypothetical protein